MMRFIPYVLYLLLIAFYRTNLIGLFSIEGVEIYLTALIVLLVALNKDYLTTLWFAFMAGLVYDSSDPSLLGVHMIILVVIGITASRARERLNLESIRSRLLLVVAGLFIYSIPYTLIYPTSGVSEFFRLFIRMSIPSIFYTALVGWLYFMVQTGRLSYSRLKSIF